MNKIGTSSIANKLRSLSPFYNNNIKFLDKMPSQGENNQLRLLLRFQITQILNHTWLDAITIIQHNYRRAIERNSVKQNVLSYLSRNKESKSKTKLSLSRQRCNWSYFLQDIILLAQMSYIHTFDRKVLLNVILFLIFLAK